MFCNQVITIHDPDVVGSVVTQLALKAGLKIWGKKGRDAIHSEMKQLQMRYTFLPLHWKNMSYDQRK